MVKRRRKARSGSQKRKGPVPSQNTIIRRLDELAKYSGYVTKTRKADKKRASDIGQDIKEFRPDVILDPLSKGERRVFEVERNINNHTVFKSLVSLFYFLSKNKKSFGGLIVPDNKRQFVEKCLNVMGDIVRAYDRGSAGAPMKIRIDVISFAQVTQDANKVQSWFDGGKVGAPPKCLYLPRSFS